MKRLSKLLNKNITYEIAMSAIILALAIILGMTGFIKVGAGIYLTAIPLFLTPFLLRFRWSILVTILSVVIVDGVTAWIALTWISIIGYTTGVLIVWGFSKFKNDYLYMVGIVVASVVLVVIYGLLYWAVVKERGLAVEIMIGTSIQMAVVSGIAILLVVPIKQITKKYYKQ